MAQFISPGVYTYEKDLSQYVSDLSTTIVAMVGTADVGPVNIPTLVTSSKQFVDLFGKQNPKHFLGYAALSYLSKGTKLYVTRVAPADAKKAKVTLPLPAPNVTPIAGKWKLVSSTASTASFQVSDFDGLTAAQKTVKLDASTVLPSFDFTDSTGAAFANGKIGSDLASFNTSMLVDKFVKGSRFAITSGPGKDSTSTVTGLDANAVDGPIVTVNSSKLNSFNSPLTTTAVGSVTFSGVRPAVGSELFLLGKTSTNGDIKVVFEELDFNEDASFDDTDCQDLLDVLQAADVVAKTNALESLVSVADIDADGDIDVVITLPMFETDAIKNSELLGEILNGLLNIIKSSAAPSVTLVNLFALYSNARIVTASGIIGLGSLDSVSGISSGIKGTLFSDTAELKLLAILPGAFGCFEVESLNAEVSAAPMEISGQFSLNIFRPSWVMSDAGGSLVPTLLKFSSIGDGDFSNTKITVSFDPASKKDGAQIYTVRVFVRSNAATVAADSDLLNDFVLTEQFDGVIDVIRDNINISSNLIRLRVDFVTDDVANLETLVVTHDPVDSDNLVLDPTISVDITGRGFMLGASSSEEGQVLLFSILGGSAGSVVTASDIVGDSASKTGLHSFDDPESVDINLLVAPGWSADPSVAKEMLAICENRSDSFAIIDTPFALNVQQVIKFRNEVLNANTSYGAVYYPWVKVKDAVNDRDVFMPPSGLVVSQYAFSDQVGDVYAAPAGLNRGSITNAIVTERILNRGDRDLLYLNQINPIHFEAGFGTYIRGQKTLQVAPTALDRVNVRRLFLSLRKIIATASRSFEFEPADSVSALRLKQIAESVLEDYARKGAIKTFNVDVSNNINTAFTVENNELRMSISITPVKTAEKIIEEFIILGQGGGIIIAS